MRYHFLLLFLPLTFELLYRVCFIVSCERTLSVTLLLIFSSFLRKFLSLHLISFISTSVSSLIFNFISLSHAASSSSSYSQSLPRNVFFCFLLTLRQTHTMFDQCLCDESTSLFFHCIQRFFLLFLSTLSLFFFLTLCQTPAYCRREIQFIVPIDVFLLLPLLSSQVLQLYCCSNSFSLQTLVLSGDDYYLIPRRKANFQVVSCCCFSLPLALRSPLWLSSRILLRCLLISSQYLFSHM